MRKLLDHIYALVFPPKCVLCRKVLKREETDLCRRCRIDTAAFSDKNLKLPYLAHWTALWYYEDNVRNSILRFKFYGSRSYAETYGRMLAMKIINDRLQFDIITWVPISSLRRWRRGYDQVALIAEAVSKELDIPLTCCLKKIRNNPPQARLGNAAQRRANVLGVYRCPDPALVRGKKILLLDDVITTGATAGECARMLLTAGAEEVLCLTVAAASHQPK